MTTTLSPPTPPKKKSHKGLKIATAIVGSLFLIGIISTATGGGNTTPTSSPASSRHQADKPAKQHAAPTPTMTTSQANAIEAAKGYLRFAPFSRAGLIQQLSSKAGDGYPLADAVFAVNHLTVNWNEQAVRSARAYLQMSSFSREGLIQQLSSSAGDGYTYAQAVYAANHVGL